MLDGGHVTPPVGATPRNVQHLPEQTLVQFAGHLEPRPSAVSAPPAAASTAGVRAMVGDVPDQEVPPVVVHQPVGEIVDVVAILLADAGAVYRAADRCMNIGDRCVGVVPPKGRAGWAGEEGGGSSSSSSAERGVFRLGKVRLALQHN